MLLKVVSDPAAVGLDAVLARQATAMSAALDNQPVAMVPCTLSFSHTGQGEPVGESRVLGQEDSKVGYVPVPLFAMLFAEAIH